MAMQSLSIILLLTTFLILPLTILSKSSLPPPPLSSPFPSASPPSAPSPQSSPPPSPAAPSPSPASFSPSVYTPSYLAPKSPSPTPTPSPTEYTYPPPTEYTYPPPMVDSENSTAPAPDVSDNVDDLATDDDASSGRSNGGKKVGIALGVISVACILVVGAMVYKKRQHNIRRSRYSYSATARREFL